MCFCKFYRCDCLAGYAPISEHECEDVDECADDPDMCGGGTCDNLPGSYSCTCPPGYLFDGTTCAGMFLPAEYPQKLTDI